MGACMVQCWSFTHLFLSGGFGEEATQCLLQLLSRLADLIPFKEAWYHLVHRPYPTLLQFFLMHYCMRSAILVCSHMEHPSTSAEQHSISRSSLDSSGQLIYLVYLAVFSVQCHSTMLHGGSWQGQNNQTGKISYIAPKKQLTFKKHYTIG